MFLNTSGLCVVGMSIPTEGILGKVGRRKLGKEGCWPGHGTRIMPDSSSCSRTQELFSNMLVDPYLFSEFHPRSISGLHIVKASTGLKKSPGLPRKKHGVLSLVTTACLMVCLGHE